MRFPDHVDKTVWTEPDFETACYEVKFGKRLIRYVHSNRLSAKRVDSLSVKEPTTMPWLESFQPTDVFVDIGANVGTYSIYASAFTGCRVFSFEPESLNYAELNKNIHINKMHERVTAYCCAMTNESPRASVLHLSRFVPGFSHHDFDENRWEGPVTKLAPSMAERHRQGCIGFPLDVLVGSGQIPQPNHIKIDVDGWEGRVVEGAWKTINNPAMKSILIEIDFKLPNSVAIIQKMEEAGWGYSYDQLRVHRDTVLTKEQYRERLAKKKGGCNFIFFRSPLSHPSTPKYGELFLQFRTDWEKHLVKA